jgi:cell division protein FtsA
MNDHSLPHFVGLDIGTSNVRCVIGIADQNDPTRPSIIGYGSAPNKGMRKGNVVYVDDVAEAVVEAITEAERLSGVRIHNATVNVNGTNVVGINSRGVIAISTANREITDEDRYRVEEAATIVKLPPNREILQLFAKNYRLDGQNNIKDPVGMHGVRLEVDAHIVTSSIPNLRNLDDALNKAQIRVNRHTISSLGAAEAVLTRQQREAGTALLDIGAGTTNLLVIEDGEIQHIAVLPIGGVNITNDLAIGLKTDLDIAEKVKINHVSFEQKTKKENITVKVGSHIHTFKSDDIDMIAEARVDELLEYVERELHKIQRSRKLPGGVVLVGGTSKIPGLAEFTKEKLQLAARVGTLQPIGGLAEGVNDPTAYTAVGLMLLDMILGPVNQSQSSGGVSSTKLLQPMYRFWHSVKR